MEKSAGQPSSAHCSTHTSQWAHNTLLSLGLAGAHMPTSRTSILSFMPCTRPDLGACLGATGCCRSSSSKERVELLTSLEPAAHEASARSTSGVSRNWTMTLTEPGTLGSVMTSVAPESKISEMARSRCFL